MYRILVVDDEEWIRKGIVTKIKKSNLCFSVIEESSSAKDALNKVREIKPDIIICDIRMKEMDGLELSRTISANFPDVKIIIISGYSEFDYAAEALELGIVDYLVKPIDRYSLFKALKKCIKKIEEEKIIKAKIAAVDYIEKMNNLRIDIGDYFDKKKAIGHIFSDYNEERSVFKCIYIYLDRAVHFTIKEFAEILSKIINLKSFGKDLIIYEDRKNEYVIGFCCDKNCHEIINININSLVDQFRNEMDKRMIIQYTLGISDFGGSFKEVYYQAMNCMKYRILLDEKNVITKKQIQSRNKFIQYNHSLGASIKYNILTGNYEKISKILEDIGNTIKQKDISYSCIQNFYINLLMVALSEINTNLEQRDTIPRDAYVFDTIAQMMNYIKKIYLGLISTSEENVSGYKEQFIYEIKGYIDTHYAEDITLENIAKDWHINTSYLSKLFKEVMNINFQDYLTKVRIGQAKILLEQNKHKIKEVAELTGFNSQYYFSLAFKKIEGISPSDFMKKIAGERYFVNKADTIDFHKS